MARYLVGAIHVEAGYWFNPIPTLLLLLTFPGRFLRSIVLLSGLLLIQYEVQVKIRQFVKINKERLFIGIRGSKAVPDP